ncbi:hypothetical protein BC828DRAFT_382069 [Blastocladiella britannica]|nr:hypothetical protein BC828DRAFT_382069 [Blastocladiella britannica]
MEAFDERDLEFVDPPNSNLVCPVCASVFVDAVSLECGHALCQRCLAQALASGGANQRRCPVCRQPVARDPVPSYALRSLADELLVQCPNEPLGCAVTPARTRARTHALNECTYRPVSCPHCGSTVAESALAAHQASDACTVAAPTTTTAAETEAEALVRVAAVEAAITRLVRRQDDQEHRVVAAEAELAAMRFAHASVAESMASMAARIDALESQAAAGPPPMPPMPPAMMDFELALDRMAVDVDAMRAALTHTELRASVDLQTESLRLREEIQAVKAATLSLKASMSVLAAQQQRLSASSSASGSTSAGLRMAAEALRARASSAGMPPKSSTPRGILFPFSHTK